MDESITIILLSLAELCLVAIGLAIFFYFQSKKYKVESLKISAAKQTQSPSDNSTIHGYFHDQVQQLQALQKDSLGDAKTAIETRIKILQNESLLLSKNDIDYEQQLKFYHKVLTNLSTIIEEPTAEINTKAEDIEAKDTLFELDELELPGAAESKDSTQTIDTKTPTHDLADNSTETQLNEEIEVFTEEHAFESDAIDEFTTAAVDEFEVEDEETFETAMSDEFELADEETFETAMSDEFELGDEETFETIAEDEFGLTDEETFESIAEDEFGLANEEEFEPVGEDEFVTNIEDDTEFVTENDNENIIDEVSSEEENDYGEDIPILQDTIELDAPLITGELKNESAEIGKIRNIVSSLHGTIEELKQFSDEHELDADAGEYLTTKLEEIEISNARLNLCTETLERDNARLLELVNQKEEEPQEAENIDSEKSSVEVIPEKDRKEKIELLEVELSSLEKRLNDKTNHLDDLQSQDSEVSHTEGDDSTQIFDQLMREIDNLTELLTVKSEELSKLRVHAIDIEEELEQHKETGT